MKSIKSLPKYLIWTISIGLILLILFFKTFFMPNYQVDDDSEKYIYVRDSASYNDVIDSLRIFSSGSDVLLFKIASTILGYEKIKPGRYEISGTTSNFNLVRRLKNGRQEPLNLTFNNIRTKNQLAARLSTQIMADSTSIVQLLSDSAFLASEGFTPETSIAVFIPNTYELYWDTDAKELFAKMKKEYDKFWNDERKQKAAAIPLSQVEVHTLASIVEEETNSKAERPKVAGLYINRLKTNMPLQADPTLKFAVGDFSIKRLKLEHILKISPYNTYRNKGLPPGPIRVASANGIDAVLNYEKHAYIFMCAKETFDGQHNFAVTYAEHTANARRYQKALDALKIN